MRGRRFKVDFAIGNYLKSEISDLEYLEFQISNFKFQIQIAFQSNRSTSTYE